MAITLGYQDDDYFNTTPDLTQLAGLQFGDSLLSNTFAAVEGINLSLGSLNSTEGLKQDDTDIGTVPSIGILVTTTTLRALVDSELPAGEGGPSTTQIWKTG